jgi:methylmalonyl-CoA epimerase
MFKGLDHVVVAVKDLDAAVARHEAIYDVAVSERREAPAAGMKMAFFRFGDTFVELVSNLGEEGPIAKRLAERGEGVHLIAMRVDDLQATLAALRARNVRLVGDPGPGAPVRGQVFIHPSETGGVLTQLVQG